LELLICVGVPLLVLLVPLIWFIGTYNRLTSLRNHIRDSWGGIDVELKRRYDLIPNLVSTVRAYASHERDVLERVTALREKAASNHGPAASQASDESNLLLGLRQLLIRAEAYPDLKADANFRMLQTELANTEDRIAAARRFFNGNIREYNSLCQTVPTNIVASLTGHRPETYFEISAEAERVVPRIELGHGGPPASPGTGPASPGTGPASPGSAPLMSQVPGAGDRGDRSAQVSPSPPPLPPG
jgi:LemA protein